MIRKNHFGTQTVCCDFCSDFFDTNEIEFREAWADAKKAGWKAVPSSNDSWKHVCPSCQELSLHLRVDR